MADSGMTARLVGKRVLNPHVLGRASFDSATWGCNHLLLEGLVLEECSFDEEAWSSKAFDAFMWSHSREGESIETLLGRF